MPTYEAGNRLRSMNWPRWRGYLLAGYFSWFLIPLFLASLARPFALWDYFTSTGLFHKGRPIEWGTLVGNALHNLFTGQYVIRPVAVFLYDLQTLVFGGEFWLWYALKWAAFGVSVWLVTKVLEALGCDWMVRAAVASLLLFHPARFTLMLHAPDGWVALGMIAQVWLLVGYGFDASRLSKVRMAAWMVLACFTIGAKEVGFVFQGGLVLFVALMNRRAWLRLMPHVVLVGAWLWILTAGAERAKGFTIGAWWGRFLEQGRMLFPLSPMHGLEIVVGGLMLVSLYFAVRGRETVAGRLVLFCWVTGLGMLAFVVIPPLVALRYVIPPLYLMAMAIGLALRWLPRWGNVVAGVLLVVYPLLTMGNVCRQELAYQHQFFEISTALGEMDSKARAGYSLALTGMSGDFEGESFHTIQRYFFQYGPKWYGLDAARGVVHVKETGWPETRFTVLSLFEPGRLEREGNLDMRRVEAAYALTPGDFGVLGKLAAGYYALDRVLGRPDVYWYDNGGPEIRRTPHFYLYVVGDANAAGRVNWVLQEMPAGRRPGGF